MSACQFILLSLCKSLFKCLFVGHTLIMTIDVFLLVVQATPKIASVRLFVNPSVGQNEILLNILELEILCTHYKVKLVPG